MRDSVGEQRRVCFVTGARAEFGLMRTALEAMQRHPRLRLQIVVTGMHLDREHGEGLAEIRRAGFEVDAVVRWPPRSGRSAAVTAQNTGRAMAELARTVERLRSDIVLVVGDRVEALAGAAAGHLSQRVVAHVHGGDRASGQTDDSVRHAITKLSHVHFPATAKSARRIERMGEEKWRIHQVGCPGVDGIAELAEPWEVVAEAFRGLKARRYALVVLHPVEMDERVEERRAGRVLEAVTSAGFERVVVVYPNNDPGSGGIVKCWKEKGNGERFLVRRDVPRGVFLGVLRDAAVLVGNSSSGIIEAASFGTAVVDIGPRQAGRERSGNVIHCEYDPSVMRGILRGIWGGGRARRMRCRNVYGGDGAGARMADILAQAELGPRLLRKLIRY